MPASSGNVALFTTNSRLGEVYWFSYFATFVRLTIALMSAHTIQSHWGIIWKFKPFAMCGTPTNQVCNSQISFNNYTSFVKGVWVLFKNLTAKNWLQAMDKLIQNFIVGNTTHLTLNTFYSIYIPSKRALLHIFSLLISCMPIIVGRFKSVHNIYF